MRPSNAAVFLLIIAVQRKDLFVLKDSHLQRDFRFKENDKRRSVYLSKFASLGMSIKRKLKAPALDARRFYEIARSLGQTTVDVP